MTTYYKSKLYLKPIRVENIEWEKLVIITDVFEREIIYSWYNLIEQSTWSTYINKCLLWGFIKKIPTNVLIIWFWAWTFAKFLEDHIWKINITWIDIDKTMIDIAKKEFDIKTNDLYIEDAIKALSKIINKEKQYDLVLVDIYWWDGEIPKYFSEEIFFKRIQKILLKNGVLSINFANHKKNNSIKNGQYNKIHLNLINIFWKYYSHIITWKNDYSNVSWIYNLDKYYSATEYDSNYMKQFRQWNILFNENIIKNTILEK